MSLSLFVPLLSQIAALAERRVNCKTHWKICYYIKSYISAASGSRPRWEAAEFVPEIIRTNKYVTNARKKAAKGVKKEQKKKIANNKMRHHSVKKMTYEYFRKSS